MKLLTVTWSGDRMHFDLLRYSLERSRLAGLPHEVVVQDDELSLFEPYDEPPVRLLSSRDVLPEEVEIRRCRAARWRQRLGRRATIVAGSVTRYIGWPSWVRYTGWHTQQLCKLAMAAASEVDTVVVLDSDVVVTAHAGTEDFVHGGGAAVCFQKWVGADELSRKRKHWQENAHCLLDLGLPRQGPFDCYYDTPFVFHAPAVRRMLSWLETRYRQPWWQVLLKQPPRRWSEFGIYGTFLRHHYDEAVDWRDSRQIGYLHDASNVSRLAAEFRRLQNEQRQHYITIQSQSNGRHSWSPGGYHREIRKVLAPCGSLPASGSTRD